MRRDKQITQMTIVSFFDAFFAEPGWPSLKPRCMLGFMASSAALPLGRGFNMSRNRTILIPCWNYTLIISDFFII